MNQTAIFWTGLLGVIAALLVGVAEFTFQFSPAGGYENEGYRYFADVSLARLTFGHFLGVLCAPLYIAGYFHVFLMLRPTHPRLGFLVFVLGAYSFMVGDVWLGGRVNLALIVHAQEMAPAVSQEVLSGLLRSVSEYNEPLINIVRLTIGALSVLLSIAILSGRSCYPRAFIFLTPAVVLAAIVAVYGLYRPLGVYLLPAAMNFAHLALFGGSTWLAGNMVRRQALLQISAPRL